MIGASDAAAAGLTTPDARGLTGLIVAAGSNTEAALRECLDAVLAPSAVVADAAGSNGTAGTSAAAALSHRTNDGFSPIASAAISGHRANLRTLVRAARAHLDSGALWRVLTDTNINGANALHHAAAFSHPRATATFIEALEAAAPSTEALQVRHDTKLTLHPTHSFIRSFCFVRFATCFLFV
jgi:ankyrin repeat protein